ncbi:hypothetical protein I315_02285 [Cryptococcus gattii Ru294]|nr:hypothetical protein I315_02285 [Cryptococcus gattii Ru294]
MSTPTGWRNGNDESYDDGNGRSNDGWNGRDGDDESHDGHGRHEYDEPDDGHGRLRNARWRPWFWSIRGWYRFSLYLKVVSVLGSTADASLFGDYGMGMGAMPGGMMGGMGTMMGGYGMNMGLPWGY